MLGVAQLSQLGHAVVPAFDIEEARQVLEKDASSFQAIIADHRLPDGWGVDFLIELQEAHPNLMLAIVSGCLTKSDEQTLRDAGIPYFRKPLIYSSVVKRLRQLTAPPKASVQHRQEAQSPKVPQYDESGNLPPPPPPPGKRLELPRPALQKKKGLTSIIFGKLTKK